MNTNENDGEASGSGVKPTTRGLATLFGLWEHEQEAWGAADLGGVLRHQLNARLEYDLGTVGPQAQQTLADFAPAPASAPAAERFETFADLLGHASPPVQLLQLVKDYAKRSRSDGSLPKEVATVLYFASLAVAQVRCGTRISELDDAKLAAGVRWALEQPWLDELTRGALHEAARKLP